MRKSCPLSNKLITNFRFDRRLDLREFETSAGDGWDDLEDVLDEELMPFRQGHLDRFCGLYAAVNALNLASDEIVISHGEATNLFSNLLPMALDLVSERDWAFKGLKGGELEELVKAILYGQRAVHRPFKLAHPDLFRTIDNSGKTTTKGLIRSVSKRRGCALIVRIVHKSSGQHWSVAQSVKGKTVRLFDSANIDSVPLKRCKPWRVVISPLISG